MRLKKSQALLSFASATSYELAAPQNPVAE